MGHRHVNEAAIIRRTLKRSNKAISASAYLCKAGSLPAYNITIRRAIAVFKLEESRNLNVDIEDVVDIARELTGTCCV